MCMHTCTTVYWNQNYFFHTGDGEISWNSREMLKQMFCIVHTRFLLKVKIQICPIFRVQDDTRLDFGSTVVKNIWDNTLVIITQWHHVTLIIWMRIIGLQHFTESYWRNFLPHLFTVAIGMDYTVVRVIRRPSVLSETRSLIQCRLSTVTVNNMIWITNAGE